MASSSGCVRGADVSSWPDDAGRDASVWRPDVTSPGERFPRTHRLTQRRQFQTTYERGTRVSSSSFVLFGLANDIGHGRLGLTVTRRIGGAVVRNRAKRRLREIYRRHRVHLRAGVDVVVNVRHTMIGQAYAALEQEFLRAFDRLVARMPS